MDLSYAIERHRKPLLVIIAALYAKIGLTEGGSVERLSRTLYRAVLMILYPAEAAVRRLIVVAAYGLEVEPSASRSSPNGRSKSRKSGKRKRRARSFPLFDPQIRLTFGHRRPTAPQAEPRIRFFPFDPRVPAFLRPAPPQPEPAPKPEPGGTVNARSLCRRLAAIMNALNDLNRQAMRYARLQARLIGETQPKRTPLRRGPPPGLRSKSSHEVHAILSECHYLARALPAVDSS